MPTNEETSNPFEGTIAIKVSKHSFGIHRKVKNYEAKAVTQDGSTVDEKAILMTKKLLECKEYKEIGKLDSKLNSDLALLSVPSVLWDGVILIPFEGFRRAKEILDKWEQDRAKLVKVFVFGAYERAVENARETLGQLFNSSQYPTTNQVAQKFWVEIRTVDFSASSNLKKLDAELWEEESRKIRETMREAGEEMKFIMRAEFLKLSKHLVDVLSGEREEGKPKVFRDSAITNVTDWLDAFKVRNITNDQELAGLVEKCKKLVSGIDPDDLRKDMDFRMETAKAMEKVTKSLDSLLVNRPGRKFSFDEEGQDAAQ